MPCKMQGITVRYDRKILYDIAMTYKILPSKVNIPDIMAAGENISQSCGF